MDEEAFASSRESSECNKMELHTVVLERREGLWEREMGMGRRAAEGEVELHVEGEAELRVEEWWSFMCFR